MIVNAPVSLTTLLLLVHASNASYLSEVSRVGRCNFSFADG